MRPSLVLALILFFAINAAAQAPKPSPSPEEATKLEKFQSRTGTVVIKNFSRIGSLRGIGGSLNVQSMDFTDAQSGATVQGMMVEIKESGRLERSERSFIDSDEIDGLLKGIDYIAKVQSPTTKQDFFEARYRTRSDFGVTTFNSSDASEGIQVAVTIGRFSQVSIYLKLTELSTFRELILMAKGKLEPAK